MRCPYCGEVSNRVIDSRLTRDSQEIRRRRECDECARRFTTRERVEEVQPKIVKRDERREEYDRTKLEHSIQKACTKRPVSERAIQRLVDRVERLLPDTGEAEVSSEFIGRLVLEELMALDPMAAARFASVFRRFSSAADYTEFFASIEAPPSGSPPRKRGSGADA
jgi:transcriptional repressor NrdR